MGTKPIEKILPYYTYQFNELELELANTKPKSDFILNYTDLYSFWL